MPYTDERILESLGPGEYPLLCKLLKTDARPYLLRELRRLISRRWSNRAPREDVEILGRLRGCGMDQAVFVRNISVSGVLLEVEFPQGIQDDGTPICLLLRTDEGIIELPMKIARVKAGGPRRQVAFEFANTASQLAAQDLRNLFFGVAADT